MAIQAEMYTNNLGLQISQDFMIENGYGLGHSCFNSQEQSLRQLFIEKQRNQNQNQNMFFGDANVVPLSMSHGLALHFEKQSLEIDRYVRLQNERLRVMMQEQRRTWLKRVESEMVCLLRQKDEEIAEATRKKMELEGFVRKMEEENQAWRRVAQEKEAMVVSLNNALEEMKERALIDDAGSCCNDETEETEVEEEDEEEEESSRKTMMVCKSCKCGKSSFLFLPCRHLCCCKECEAVLQACPVCSVPKKASIETLIF